jgi:hypothetical protein
MTDKILATIKKMLDLNAEESTFDEQILVFINEAILSLKKLDVIPETNIVIVDAETDWAALEIMAMLLYSATTYIFLSVRLIFDPPTNGQYASTLEKKKLELESRFSMYEMLPETPVEEEPE